MARRRPSSRRLCRSDSDQRKLDAEAIALGSDDVLSGVKTGTYTIK